MKVDKIKLNAYRNIDNIEIEANSSINVIYGDNAQGKTNIIEAIWMFTGNQSFRGSKIHNTVALDKKAMQISISFSDYEREQKAKIKVKLEEKKIIKKATLNGVELKRISELNGNFYAVVFSPILLSLVKNGPQHRREFLDAAISQIKPQYKQYLLTYDKLINQRNALLKMKYRNLNEQLEAWDLQIAKAGTALYLYRKDYLQKLIVFCKKYYAGISSQKEEFNMLYTSTVFRDEDNITEYDQRAIDIYIEKLRENREVDIKNGSTTCGIHRDDIEFIINDLSVRVFGSQGQQRSVVITLKLSEAALLKKVTGENPIILLDDVMSELDESRQEYILNNLSDMQVFITCCDVSNIKSLKKGRVFWIENGTIKEQRDNI